MIDIVINSDVTKNANEEGTLHLTLSFADEDGDAVPPNTLVWSLIRSDGSIINNRKQVEISNPGVSNSIVLSGDDLAFSAAEVDLPDVERFLVVEATYTSDIGVNLPLNEMGKFKINNLYLNRISE